MYLGEGITPALHAFNNVRVQTCSIGMYKIPATQVIDASDTRPFPFPRPQPTKEGKGSMVAPD